MDSNPVVDLLWPIITGSIIVPVVGWIKGKLPNDFPVQGVVFQSILSIGIVFLLSQAFSTGWTWQQIITYALGTFASASAVHAIVKTNKKLGGGNGSETPTA